MVYKARDSETQQKVAIKKIRLEHCEDGIPQTTLREISFLKELDHPNVVKLLDIVSLQALRGPEDLPDFRVHRLRSEEADAGKRDQPRRGFSLYKADAGRDPLLPQQQGYT